MNDYVQNIYLYNAEAFKINMKYDVTATMTKSQATQKVGLAVYDEDTDRLVVTADEPLCLSAIEKLDFSKSA